MSLGVARAKLIGSLKDLMVKWETVRMSWDDANSRALEEKVLQPLERQVRSAVTAMEKASETVARARRDCGE